jgi:tetratricopeptide (TPR) repeat protein
MQFDQQLYSDTLSTLNTIQPDRFAPPSFWLLRGQSLLRSNQMSEAEAHYEQWLSVSPLNREATIGRLMIIDARQDYEKGLQIVDAFLDKRQDTQILVLKGYFHARLGQTQKGQAVIDSLDSSVQALPFIRGVVSRLHFQRGDYDKAASDANIAYKANPELSQLLVLIASLEAQGKNDEAFEVLQIHTQTRPDDQGAKILFAERQLRKNADDAIATYVAIQQKSPDNLIVLNNLAYLYLEKGEVDKALPLAQRAVELQPALPAAVDTLAQIYVAKDDLDRARDLYDSVMNNPVDNDEVVQNYVTLLVKQGDVERARRRFNNHEWQDQTRKNAVEALF